MFKIGDDVITPRGKRGIVIRRRGWKAILSSLDRRQANVWLELMKRRHGDEWKRKSSEVLVEVRRDDKPSKVRWHPSADLKAAKDSD